jgi:hypothetical protein
MANSAAPLTLLDAEWSPWVISAKWSRDYWENHGRRVNIYWAIFTRDGYWMVSCVLWRLGVWVGRSHG